MQTARESQTEVAHRDEVARISETVEDTWEQELVTAGLIRGQVQEARRALRSLLEQRFGPLPAALTTQIEQTADLDRLHSAIDRVLTIHSVAECEP